MSYEEKNTVLQIIIGVVINVWIILKIQDLYTSGIMDSPAAVQMWAESVFLIIVISIIVGIFFTIFGTIIFSILETLISGRTDQEFILDESDKAISNTGNKITIGFMGAGFIILIVGIKFGYEIIDCLVVLMLCFSVGSLFGEFAKLARYRMSI